MPYISVEEVDVIRKELKEAFPNIKFSVVREHYSGVLISVMKGDMRFPKEYEQINEHYPERYENGEFLKKVIGIASKNVRTIANDGDYGNIPNYYVSVHVGKWNKPYEQITK